jgi:hypothetical protein
MSGHSKIQAFHHGVGSMKNLLSVITLASLVSLTSAWVASAQESASRDEAIRQCVAQAQGEVPNVSGDPNDPSYTRRANIYSACMVRMGQKP